MIIRYFKTLLLKFNLNFICSFLDYISHLELWFKIKMNYIIVLERYTPHERQWFYFIYSNLKLDLTKFTFNWNENLLAVCFLDDEPKAKRRLNERRKIYLSWNELKYTLKLSLWNRIYFCYYFLSYL